MTDHYGKIKHSIDGMHQKEDIALAKTILEYVLLKRPIILASFMNNNIHLQLVDEEEKPRFKDEIENDPSVQKCNLPEGQNISPSSVHMQCTQVISIILS